MPPATRWVYDSAHSSAGSSSALAVTSGTVTPSVGDLMIVGCLNFESGGTHNTAFAITDTGSNTGWNQIKTTQNPGAGTAIMAAFWRFATATDHAASPFTVTSTASGGTGTQTSRITVEVHRVPGFVLLGIESSAVAVATASGTTLSAFGTSTPPYVDGDLLAWSMLAMSLSNGGVTQDFYETSNPSTAIGITATGLGTPLLLQTSNSDAAASTHNPCISTNGTVTFLKTWTTARTNTCVFGATFNYRHTAGLLPIL